MDFKYDDPVEGPTVRYVPSDGTITITGLPRDRGLFLELQRRIRQLLIEMDKPEFIKAS